MSYDQWTGERRECVAFVEGVGEYPLRIFRDGDGAWWMAGYVPNDNGTELVDVYDPLGDRRIWPIRTPSDDDLETVTAEWLRTISDGEWCELTGTWRVEDERRARFEEWFHGRFGDATSFNETQLMWMAWNASQDFRGEA